MIFVMQMTIMLGLLMLATGFVIFHAGKSHNYARLHAFSIRIFGFILILIAVVIIVFNFYVYLELVKQNKFEQLIPFEIAQPLTYEVN